MPAEPCSDRKHRIEVAKRPDGGEDNAGHRQPRMLCRSIGFQLAGLVLLFRKIRRTSCGVGALVQEGWRRSWSGTAPSEGAAGPRNLRITTRARVHGWLPTVSKEGDVRSGKEDPRGR